MKIKRQYGPWRGYSSSRSRFTIRPDHMGPDSLNALLNPLEEYAYRRGGTSATGIGATTGVLETVVADATMKSMQAFPFISPTLTDSYPTWGVVWADESKKFGQIGFRSSNGATDQVPVKSFGTTHYTHSDATVNHLRFIPMPYIHNATGYTRGVFAENRARMAAGSRRVEQVGDDLQMPNYFATPYRWKNRRFNDAVGSGSEAEIHLPLGHIPPLWPGVVTEPTGQAAVASWQAGYQFYHAVAFMDQNGALSMPSVPRAPQTAGLTSGVGLKTIASTSAYYVSMTWTLPIGPPGTKARVVLRSPQKSATAAPYVPPDPLDMRVTAVVLNNTATTYVDPNGGDGNLLVDAERVRWDHRMPPSGRWMWTFDQRLAIGDLTPNPAAIFIAPTGVTTGLRSATPNPDLNLADDSVSAYGSTKMLVSIQPTRLRLRWAVGGLTVSQNITLNATTTIQQIVDTINATTVASAGKEWAAALCPGADGNAPSTSLAPTSQNVVCATTDTLTTVTSAALFGPVPVGARIFGTGIPAGAYVKSIESTSSMTISAAATATGAPTLTFYSDVDDDYIIVANTEAGDGNIDKYGNQHVICGALPMLVGFTKSYLDAFPARPYSMAYTGASPGHPPNAANNWYQDNELSLPSTLGRFMAAGHVSSGNVVSLAAFSEGVAVIRNMRGGGTALDSDYRLLSTASRRGCISPPSFVQGNGWCGWLSQEGYVISEGEASSEVVISAENFLQSESGGVGDWAYEIGQCAAATASGAATWGFHAMTASGRLWVSYRTSASTRVVQCYDFSAGLGSSGVAEVTRQDGTPWGWSAPLTYNWAAYSSTNAKVNAMCAVRKSDGLYLIAADDTNNGTTCGLVSRFEAGGFTDAAVEITTKIYTLTDRCDTFDKKALQNVTSMHSCPNAAGPLLVYRRYDRSASGALTLATTTDAFKVLRMEVPQRERTLTDQVEFLVQSSDGVGAMKSWGLEAEVEVVANAR